jgi:hypothetical protein
MKHFCSYIIIIETQSDTPLYIFVLAHYTVYSNMRDKLLHVSAQPSHHLQCMVIYGRECWELIKGDENTFNIKAAGSLWFHQ